MRALDLAPHGVFGPGVVDEGRALELHDRLEVVEARAAHEHAHCSTRLPGEGVTSGARR